MPDQPTPTSPAANTGGRACTHWRDSEARHCGNTQGVRLYLTGPRCPSCTPAAVAGHAEPPSPQPTSGRTT
ncbi:hypothetical protein B1L11_06745 [Microbispora sp. GKU 823]|nr:hypothetical protein B1L11_06745 [Microbispora sp. GKU 823]